MQSNKQRLSSPKLPQTAIKAATKLLLKLGEQNSREELWENEVGRQVISEVENLLRLSLKNCSKVNKVWIFVPKSLKLN